MSTERREIDMSTKLKLPSGSAGFFNNKNEWQCTGSKMGRSTELPENTRAPHKLHLERLQWVDGDYDQGGAYWGNTGKDDIYCAWSNDDERIYIYTRAASVEQAKQNVHNILPLVTFY